MGFLASGLLWRAKKPPHVPQPGPSTSQGPVADLRPVARSSGRWAEHWPPPGKVFSFEGQRHREHRVLTLGGAACGKKASAPLPSPSPPWSLDGQPRSLPPPCSVRPRHSAVRHWQLTRASALAPEWGWPTYSAHSPLHGAVHTTVPVQALLGCSRSLGWLERWGGLSGAGGLPPGAGCSFSLARPQGSKPQADPAGLGTKSVDRGERPATPTGPGPQGLRSQRACQAPRLAWAWAWLWQPTATSSDPGLGVRWSPQSHPAGPVPRLEPPAAARPARKLLSAGPAEGGVQGLGGPRGSTWEAEPGSGRFWRNDMQVTRVSVILGPAAQKHICPLWYMWTQTHNTRAHVCTPPRVCRAGQAGWAALGCSRPCEGVSPSLYSPLLPNSHSVSTSRSPEANGLLAAGRAPRVADAGAGTR